MKDFDYYSKPQVPYPNKDDYTTVYLYDKGELVWSGNHYDYTYELKKNYPDAVVQKVVNEEELKKRRRAYGEEVHRLHEEFKNDLFAAFNVTNNPKRERAYQLAVQFSDEQLSNIYDYFYDLVTLIED